MSATEWTLIAAGWLAGYVPTAVGVFRHWQGKFPDMARTERNADATFAAAFCLPFWPVVAIIWLIGRTLGSAIAALSDRLPGGRP